MIMATAMITTTTTDRSDRYSAGSKLGVRQAREEKKKTQRERLMARLSAQAGQVRAVLIFAGMIGFRAEEESDGVYRSNRPYWRLQRIIC